MPRIKKLSLDVLKPLEPNLVDFSKKLCSLKGVKSVNLIVQEMDRKTETLKAIIEGKNIRLDLIRSTIEEMGGVIHSIDQTLAEK